MPAGTLLAAVALMAGAPPAVDARSQQAGPAAVAADAPLPDFDAFEAQVKARLRTDRALQANYTFLERRDEIEISKLGKVSSGTVKTFEVYPSPEPGNTYKRLVAVNGVPLPADELARNDAKHQKDVLDRANESPAERARHNREAEDDRREEREGIDEVFRVYDIKMIGRETLAGYPTIVATLEPRKAYQPSSDDGRMMKRFRARVWVHEFDYQLVKVWLEAVDDVTYGWGLVARLRRGATVTYVRRKVNDEVWLPARLEIAGSGRTLIFRGFQLDAVTEWSDYKRFQVKTDEKFSGGP